MAFGDIGTSPLCAMRECFHGSLAMAPTPDVLGVLSLIFWSLTLIVSLKYVAYVLRADNHGEGGILALMTLVNSALRSPRWRGVVITLAVFGAALLYGDGVITLPLTIAILVGLFAIQRHGTERVGIVFGPIMALLLNHLGQGALLIREPSAASNPFFRTMPEWALYPGIVLATAAAVIASLALISGSTRSRDKARCSVSYRAPTSATPLPMSAARSTYPPSTGC